jgi:hypothetical protein
MGQLSLPAAEVHECSQGKTTPGDGQGWDGACGDKEGDPEEVGQVWWKSLVATVINMLSMELFYGA